MSNYSRRPPSMVGYYRVPPSRSSYYYYRRPLERASSIPYVYQPPEKPVDYYRVMEEARTPPPPPAPAGPPHTEAHFESAEVVRDIIIGLSDGLTVPFALAAGLSSLGSTQIVIFGGAAELVSGAISMGLGGYLAALSDIEHYKTERLREVREIVECPQEEEEEIVDILSPYGLDRNSIQPILKKLKANPEKFVDFMMKFELNLECPDSKRSWISAITIGLSYFIGGLVPLLPYLFTSSAFLGLMISIGVTSFTLLVFGYVKARFVNPDKAFMGAIQTMAIGAAAAACSFGIVKILPQGA